MQLGTGSTHLDGRMWNTQRAPFDSIVKILRAMKIRTVTYEIERESGCGASLCGSF